MNLALLRKLTVPPGSYVTNSFDNKARKTETTLKTSADVELNDHAYIYNVRGRRTQQTRTDDSYVTYTYDDAGELRTAYTTNSLGSEVTSERYMFGYDAAWNMIKRTNNASVISYSINNLNENTTSYSYDSNGFVNPDGSDYHFQRQDADGGWSEKPGNLDPPRKCMRAAALAKEASAPKSTRARRNTREHPPGSTPWL